MDLPFDLVVLCAAEYQPVGARPFGSRADVLHVPLTDGGKALSPSQVSRAFRAARAVARCYVAGARVLVTCQAGLNRSGLMTALTLLDLGLSAPAAVEAIRAARPGALNNPHFVDLIFAASGRHLLRFPFERLERRPSTEVAV